MDERASAVSAQLMTESLLHNFEELVLFLRESPLAEDMLTSDLGDAYDALQLLHARLDGALRPPGSQRSNSVASSRSSISSMDAHELPPAELPLPPAHAHPLADSPLSDFVALRVIGTGTFGTVQLVRHSHSRREFAVKILDKNRIVALHQVAHLRSERNILLRLDHPFVVKVYQTYQDEQNIYFLMDHVPGGELFEYIRRKHRFTATQARFYTAEVVDALAHLHANNIMYRDLKPENVLLDIEGHVKLIDFGFAKVLARDEKAATMCGTPEYIAPEVILNQRHQHAVDWWALGILLYEMLTGGPPFAHTERSQLFESIVHCRLRFKHAIDEKAKDLITLLLVVDPEQRLGNTETGVDGIRRHAFFNEIDWDDVTGRRLQPPIQPMPTSYRFEALPPLAPSGDTNTDELFADF